MNYTKPEIVIAGSAVAAILRGTKPTGPIADLNPTKHQTLAAYEADE